MSFLCVASRLSLRDRLIGPSGEAQSGATAPSHDLDIEQGSHLRGRLDAQLQFKKWEENAAEFTFVGNVEVNNQYSGFSGFPFCLTKL